MNPLEAALLCKFTKAACPQQAIDEYTPDVWHPLLEDLRFEDAKLGVIEAAKVSPFVAPAEIRAQVKRIRGERIRAFGPLPIPPSEIPEGRAQVEWTRDMVRRIGDGEDIEREPESVALPENIRRRDELLASAPMAEVPDA